MFFSLDLIWHHPPSFTAVFLGNQKKKKRCELNRVDYSEGIMTFCFWYGLMNLCALAIIGAFASLSDETYNWLVDFLDFDKDLEDTYLDYAMLIAQTVIGIAYMYGSYLAYKVRAQM